MTQEPTIKDVLEAVQGLATHMDEQFIAVRSEMATKWELATVQQDVTAVKQDVAALKQDLVHVKEELVTEIDRFVVLHQTLDVELASLRSRCERMEGFMAQVAKKLELQYVP